MREKNYKVRGVEFTINQFGCLLHCSDWKCLGEESHQALFKFGRGGRYWATPAFYTEIR